MIPNPSQGEPGPRRAGPESPHAPAPTPELPWNTRSFRPLTGFLALVFPGLGHLTLGLPRRARLIALGVLGLFATGLLIGGFDAVDSERDRWWFYAQAAAGPVAFLTDAVHIHLRHEGLVVQGLGRMNEIGTLACALAGFMNTIAILDALFPPLRRRREGARL